jgi:hypothetical protein
VALLAVGSAQERLPEAVQAYLAGIEERLVAEPAVLAGNGTIFDLDYKFLFNKPAVDVRTGSSEAWLVGFQVGVLRGKAGGPLARLVLIDGSGNDLYHFPDARRDESIDDGVFTDGIVIAVSPDVYLVAKSSPAGRKTPGSVVVQSLGKNPRELIVFRDENFPAEPGIESDVYFHDVSGDGRKELLLERQVLHYRQGRKELQQRVFSLDAGGVSFSDVTASYQSRIATVFAAAKGNATMPKITQQGRPYDPAPFEAPGSGVDPE